MRKIERSDEIAQNIVTEIGCERVVTHRGAIITGKRSVR